MKIGLFDSGCGGFALLKYMEYQTCDIVYLADQAFLPYGNKTTEQLLLRGEAIKKQLTKEGCDIIISCCNTFSIAAAEQLKILGIHLFNKQVFQKVSGKKVLLATEYTIKSGYYQQYLNDTVFLAAPDLVRGVEAGDWEVIDLALLKIARQTDLKDTTILLGCTHFSLISDYISAFFGRPAVDGMALLGRMIKGKKGQGTIKLLTTAEESNIEQQFSFYLKREQ